VSYVNYQKTQDKSSGSVIACPFEENLKLETEKGLKLNQILDEYMSKVISITYTIDECEEEQYHENK
jgi:hypothetical protein